MFRFFGAWIKIERLVSNFTVIIFLGINEKWERAAKKMYTYFFKSHSFIYIYIYMWIWKSR